MFQPQTMVYCVVPVTPSAYPRRSSVHINNIETLTANIRPLEVKQVDGVNCCLHGNVNTFI